MNEEVTGEGLKEHLIDYRQTLLNLNADINNSITRQLQSEFYKYSKKEVDKWVIDMRKAMEQNLWLVDIIQAQLKREFNYEC